MARTRPLPLVPLAVGVIVVLGLVAVVASRGGEEGGEADVTAADVEEIRAVEVEGEPLPALEDGGADPALGRTIPEVRGAEFDGTPLTIGPGQPKVIVFVAHWCPQCQAEVPVITDWLDDTGGPDGVDLLAVSTAVSKDRPNYPPSAWLAGEGWDIPTLADDADNTAAQAFGLSAFPFFVAVDGDGTVVARTSGELEIAQLETLVNQARR